MPYTGFVHDGALMSDSISEARLYGFPINSSQLGSTHTGWLDDYVVPLVSNGGRIEVVGEASRTGSDELNLSLSQQRARSVVTYVCRRAEGRVICSSPLQSRGATVSGIGESGAAAIGQADNTEDDFFRAVHVKAWSAGNSITPPPIVAPPPTTKRKIISRRWSTTLSRSPSFGNPAASGGGRSRTRRTCTAISRSNHPRWQRRT